MPVLLKVGLTIRSAAVEFSVSVPALFIVPDPKMSVAELLVTIVKLAPTLLFKVPLMVKSLPLVFVQLIVPLFSQVRLKSGPLFVGIVVVTAEFVVSVPDPAKVAPPDHVIALVTVKLSLPWMVPPVKDRVPTLKVLPVLKVVVPALTERSPRLVMVDELIVVVPPEIVTLPVIRMFAPEIVLLVPPEIDSTPRLVMVDALSVFVPPPRVVAPVIL